MTTSSVIFTLVKQTIRLNRLLRAALMEACFQNSLSSVSLSSSSSWQSVSVQRQLRVGARTAFCCNLGPDHGGILSVVSLYGCFSVSQRHVLTHTVCSQVRARMTDVTGNPSLWAILCFC